MCKHVNANKTLSFQLLPFAFQVFSNSPGWWRCMKLRTQRSQPCQWNSRVSCCRLSPLLPLAVASQPHRTAHTPSSSNPSQLYKLSSASHSGFPSLVSFNTSFKGDLIWGEIQIAPQNNFLNKKKTSYWWTSISLFLSVELVFKPWSCSHIYFLYSKSFCHVLSIFIVTLIFWCFLKVLFVLYSSYWLLSHLVI